MIQNLILFHSGAQVPLPGIACNYMVMAISLHGVFTKEIKTSIFAAVITHFPLFV